MLVISQASSKQEETCSQCTCGAYNKVNTPPNSKRTKRSLRKEALTPKGPKKAVREAQGDGGHPGSIPQVNAETFTKLDH